jgi:hypothetical protein
MNDDLDRHEAAWLRGELDAELSGLGARPEALGRILARTGAAPGAGPANPSRDVGPGHGGVRRRGRPPWRVAAAAVAAVAAAVPLVRATREGLAPGGGTPSSPAIAGTGRTPPSPGVTHSGPTPHPTTTPGPTPSPPASTTPTTSTTSTTTTANPAAIPRCDVPSLVVSVTGPDGAAGTTFHTVILTNSGHVACYLQGFPGVAATDGTTTVDARRETGTVASRVVLPPGSAAHAVLGVRNVAGSPKPCPAYPRLLITAPDSRRTTTFPLQVHPCDGVMTITVVQPGAG